MPTLLLSPHYSNDSRALRDAAARAGWRVRRLGGWRVPDEPPAGPADVVVYGEPLFAEVIAAQVGVALLDAPADWLPGLPEPHRRRAIEPATLRDARARREPVFVKPADGRKGFEGAVYAERVRPPPVEVLGDDTPVLLAEPVIWEVEFRCFVREGRVETLSPYWRDGALARSDDGGWPASEAERAAAADYTERLLAEVPAPPAVVVDVGRISGRGWAVVEANSAWGAGVYGCDPAAVLRVLARSCVPRDRLTAGDRRWALDPVELDG